MTNNPRDPLPGQEPGQPQDPRQQPLGESAEQRAGNQPSQQQPGRPGQQMPASGAGETPATGSTASGMPASSSGSEARGYQSPQQGQQTSQSYQRTEPAYQTTRGAPPPRKSNRNLALFGILGLLAVGGIIAGFAATNNSNTSPAAAIHRPLPAHRLLANFSGTGPRFSAPFVVTGSPVTARYSYVCGSGTAAHHFSPAWWPSTGPTPRSSCPAPPERGAPAPRRCTRAAWAAPTASARTRRVRTTSRSTSRSHEPDPVARGARRTHTRRSGLPAVRA